MWIPPGFAHGFLVLSTTAEFVYKTTGYYVPKFERTIVWDDPDLAIACPLQEEPIVSPKDQVGKRRRCVMTEIVLNVLRYSLI